MDFYRHLNYRDLISAHSKTLDLSYKKIAEACSIHTSFFSRVMVKKADFSDEQLYLIAGFLRLDGEETDYLQLLGQYDRSSHHKHKKYIKDKIKIIQQRKTKTAERHDTNSLQDDFHTAVAYYSDMIHSQIHMYLSIPQFARDPQLIISKLNIRQETLNKSLAILENLRIIKKNGTSYEILKDHIHLDEDHPLSQSVNVNFRMDSIRAIREGKRPENFHFSACFTTNDETRRKIRTFLSDLVSSCREEVVKGRGEDRVTHLCLDFY